MRRQRPANLTGPSTAVPANPESPAVPTTPPAAPRQGAQAATLLALLAFGLLSMTICLPSMQQWAQQLNTTQAQVQLTFGAYVVAYGAFQLVYGPLSDRHGRRPMVMIGLAVAVVGMAMAALAPTIEALVAARFVQGAGAAACMVLGRAAVQDLFAGPRRTQMMAYVGMAMGLCPPLATVIGGQLHVHAGWQANFVLMGVVGLLLMPAAWRGLPAAAPRPSGAPRQSLWADLRQLLRHRAYRLNVAILALSGASFYAFLGGAPVLLGHLGVGPGEVGFFIMLIPMSYIVGNFAATRLVMRRGEAWMRQWGSRATALGLAGVVGLSLLGWHHPLAFVLPLLLLGIGHGLWVPATLASTVGAVPALAGSAAAVAGVTQQLLGAAGGYAVGWIPLTTAAPLGLLMLVITLAGIAAERALRR
jgi:DHA1 family bicyclomycin/chloramphenicol resistance-like MFS transporter